MAITSYSELQAAVADYLARSQFIGDVPTHISLFEAQFNRNVRVRQMETKATIGPDDAGFGFYIIPDDFLEWRRVTLQADPVVNLEYVTPEVLQTEPDTGDPRFFTIEGGKLKIKPASTLEIDLAYWGRLPALADSMTGTNWLLMYHPDIYLAGTMVVAYIYQKDPTNAAFWKNIVDGAIMDLKALDMTTRGPSAMVAMDVYTP